MLSRSGDIAVLWLQAAGYSDAPPRLRREWYIQTQKPAVASRTNFLQPSSPLREGLFVTAESAELPSVATAREDMERTGDDGIWYSGFLVLGFVSNHDLSRVAVGGEHNEQSQGGAKRVQFARFIDNNKICKGSCEARNQWNKYAYKGGLRKVSKYVPPSGWPASRHPSSTDSNTAQQIPHDSDVKPSATEQGEGVPSHAIVARLRQLHPALPCPAWRSNASGVCIWEGLKEQHPMQVNEEKFLGFASLL
ncbi:hypothetical protein D9619_004085 [Psilocybe cf. subviscida]|uniref:Uncharacterized protein n=1 Tax=Psilocybe cf. subviscida TaxID=2480587 RepID=A0A8H5BR08_9AGAR|nr:hypothetical protein D9619_004085 [Psilocybe cf. subviscida]